MKNKITKNLESLSNDIRMSTSQKKEVEDFLMSRIALETSDNQHAKIPVWLKLADAFVPANLAFKPIAVFTLILGLFFVSSFGLATASINTLPGSPFYPVKITAENIKYNLAFSDESKAKAAMSMVENRVSELKVIVKSKDNNEHQGKVAQKIKKSLNVVKEKVQNVKESDDNIKTVAMAKEIDEKLTEVKDEINETVDEIENGASEELEDVAKEMEEASRVVLAVLVEAEAGVKDETESEGEKVDADEEETKETTTEIIEEGMVKGEAEEVVGEDEVLSQDADDVNPSADEEDVSEAEKVVPVVDVLGIQQEEEESQEFEVGIN